MPKPRKIKICMSIDPEVLQEFYRVCREAGLPYSNVVESLMEYFVTLEAQVRAMPGPGATIPGENQESLQGRLEL